MRFFRPVFLTFTVTAAEKEMEYHRNSGIVEWGIDVIKPPNRPEYDVEDGVGISTMTAAEREKKTTRPDSGKLDLHRRWGLLGPKKDQMGIRQRDPRCLLLVVAPSPPI